MKKLLIAVFAVAVVAFAGTVWWGVSASNERAATAARNTATHNAAIAEAQAVLDRP